MIDSFKSRSEHLIPVDCDVKCRKKSALFCFLNQFVIGRKNFLFADTSRGADASARCYSVIETARMNNLDVYGYLLHLLTELPKFGNQPTDKQLESVMPWSQTLPNYCRKGKPIEMKDVIRT